MKAFALSLLLLAAGSAPAFAQTLASWTFETSLPASAGPFAPEVGTGSATGSHAGASVYSNPAGNGSAHSFSSTVWGVGDYYQFSTSTLGSTGINVSWDQTSSGTGPRDFKLSYSTDGTNFTQFSTYSVLLNGSPNASWSAVTAHPEFNLSYNLSSISALDNAAAVYFRLSDTSTVSANGGTVASTGTDRVDNFTIAAIPETSTYAMLMGAAGLAGAVLRRRRTLNLI